MRIVAVFLMYVALAAQPAAAVEITLHVRADGANQFVTLEDLVAKMKLLDRELIKKDDLRYPKVQADASGTGEVSWQSVTEPDANGMCRFGHGRKKVKDGDLIPVVADSAPDNCPK
jgi:hypothetical protein